MIQIIFPSWVAHLVTIFIFLQLVNAIISIFFVRTAKKRLAELNVEGQRIILEARTKNEESIALQLRSVQDTTEIIDISRSIIKIVSNDDLDKDSTNNALLNQVNLLNQVFKK